YRRQQQISEKGLSMAVVVHRLVSAEVAGVLFTRDPLDPTGTRMLVEAAWGLGENIFSGGVTPDRYFLDRATGQVRESQISSKPTQCTSHGPAPMSVADQNRPCLNMTQLEELATLGRRVEEFYGDARDVEWAFSDGMFWLLQARPLTAGSAVEREQVQQ